MESFLYKNFNSNCALVLSETPRVVQFVRFLDGEVKLEKWMPGRFHKEFKYPVNDYGFDRAVNNYLNPKIQGISVSEPARAVLSRVLEPTKKKDSRIKILKSGNPHRKGTRQEQYNLFLECMNVKDFLTLGGKEKYIDLWIEMGWICL